MQSLVSNWAINYPTPLIGILVLLGLYTAWVCGMWMGWLLGKRQAMSRTAAARIMAKASWRNRG